MLRLENHMYNYEMCLLYNIQSISKQRGNSSFFNALITSYNAVIKPNCQKHIGCFC